MNCVNPEVFYFTLQERIGRKPQNIHHEATRFANTPNSRLFAVGRKFFQEEWESMA
jgi:hypothetical protein